MQIFIDFKSILIFLLNLYVLVHVYQYAFKVLFYFLSFIFADPLLLVDDEDVIDTRGEGGVQQYVNSHNKTQSSLLVTKDTNHSNNLIFQQQKGSKYSTFKFTVK